MRYQAFHNTAKRLAQVNFNLKNLPKSVTIHLQYGKCASLLSDPVFETERKETGPLKTFPISRFVDFDEIETEPLIASQMSVLVGGSKSKVGNIEWVQLF